jgi:hypothetical protein
MLNITVSLSQEIENESVSSKYLSVQVGALEGHAAQAQMFTPAAGVCYAPWAKRRCKQALEGGPTKGNLIDKNHRA